MADSTGSSSSRRDQAILAGTLLAILALVLPRPSLADGSTPLNDDPRPVERSLSVECPALSAPHVARNAPGAGLTVSLVFDDGPGPATGQVLDILQKKGVPANFFLMGEHADAYPGLVTRMSRAGHLVGVHGWSLPAAPFHQPWPPESLDRQLTRAESAIAPKVTRKMDCYFRPPDRAQEGVEPVARQHGLTVVHPSIDSDDWHLQDGLRAAPPGLADQIYRNAVDLGRPAQQHPVVLLHDAGGFRGATLAALPRIIDFYRSNGYRFLRLDGQP